MVYMSADSHPSMWNNEYDHGCCVDLVLDDKTFSAMSPPSDNDKDDLA